MNETTLKYVLITKDNLSEATKFQNEVFPNNDAYRNYYESVFNLRDAEYYLVYNESQLVGFVGLYYEKVDLESAWLGWFGVKEEFRRQHYGTRIIKFFEDLAKEKGYKYVRLYTDKNNNDVAIKFYEKCGYFAEKYENKDDQKSLETEVLIFSKSLSNNECPKWNNKTIHLTEQYEKEKYRKQFAHK